MSCACRWASRAGSLADTGLMRFVWRAPFSGAFARDQGRSGDQPSQRFQETYTDASWSTAAGRVTAAQTVRPFFGRK